VEEEERTYSIAEMHKMEFEARTELDDNDAKELVRVISARL
jgi:hypothetical protein